MRARREHAHAGDLAFAADDEFAEKAIIPRLVFQAPAVPPGMIGIFAKRECCFVGQRSQTARSTTSFLTSAIARAGFSPLGQALAQFMIVWHR